MAAWAISRNFLPISTRGSGRFNFAKTVSLYAGSSEYFSFKHFCDGFFELAHRYQVALIGGDLTEGPLSITIQALGCIPAQKALLRKGAKPSDLIYVTGTLQAAGLFF